MGAEPRPSNWSARVGWLLVLWSVGVATMGLVAWLLRVLMNAVGIAIR